MVAVDIRLRHTDAMDISVAPGTLARELIDSADDSWIRALVDALDREVRRAPLERLLSLWDLSNAAAGRLFGVSRQAFSKWLVAGPPADRADDVAAVDDITTLLNRYVKRERIPAVVRRRAETFGERSMVEMLEAGEYEGAARLVAEMFDLRRVQP
jgi:hypothetical protein